MKITKNVMKYARGFTLIELLVVIAIIGILSSIVLASLSSARNKAQDSKVQEQLSGLRSAAEIVYASNSNSYGTVTTQGASCSASGATVFTDTASGAANIVNAIIATGVDGTGLPSASAKGTICYANNSSWMMEATLPSVGNNTSGWCVDSTGKSESIGTVTGAAGAFVTAATAGSVCP